MFHALFTLKHVTTPQLATQRQVIIKAARCNLLLLLIMHCSESAKACSAPVACMYMKSRATAQAPYSSLSLPTSSIVRGMYYFQLFVLSGVFEVGGSLLTCRDLRFVIFNCVYFEKETCAGNTHLPTSIVCKKLIKHAPVQRRHGHYPPLFVPLSEQTVRDRAQAS